MAFGQGSVTQHVRLGRSSDQLQAPSIQPLKGLLRTRGCSESSTTWTQDLERLRTFYEAFFQAEAGPKYQNAAKGFESYFLHLPSGGARVELMRKVDSDQTSAMATGYAHLALSVGAELLVNDLTDRLRTAGVPVVDGPRWTGDGYYESVVLDPDGNRIEITV